MSIDIVKDDKSINLKGVTAIEGFPDVGLVGVISSSFLIDALKLKQVAHVKSDFMPPIAVVHEGWVRDPIRFYSNGKFIVMTSELAVPAEFIYPLAVSIVNWLKSEGVSNLISLNGYPYDKRMDIEEPSVFGVGNSQIVATQLKEKGIEIIQEGFIAGLYAVLLNESNKVNLPAFALLAQSYDKYPDPGAAIVVLKVVSKLFNMSLDLKPLAEKADEIRLNVKDLMSQTQTTMQDAGKGMEGTVPAMYR
ncbi:MAG: proteasome assembly chaperone family protein [Nitrososphaerota archaeon]|nr:proteasome assembly chaperone family protein [Nitrososphaerota archaeon]